MASTPELGEVAQAFFCAIADGVGLEVINANFGPMMQPPEAKNAEEKDTFEEFEKRWNAWRKNHSVSDGAIPLPVIYKTYVDVYPTLSYDDLIKWLKAQPVWYRSSRNIAIALLKKIRTVSAPWQNKLHPPGWDDILYIRETGAMADIKKLFEIANKMAAMARTAADGELHNVMLPFSNINKWSTADIYFVSTQGTKDIKKLLTDAKEAGILFPVLNAFIRKLVKNGDLLPLSLKKNESGQVKISNVNFVEDHRVKAIMEVEYTPKTGTASKKAGDDDDEDDEETGSFAGSGFKPDFRNWATSPVGGCRFGVNRVKMKKGRWPKGNAAKHYSRSFYLLIDASSGLRLQIRHDPRGPGEIKVEVKDPASARGGSMNISVLETIIGISDPDAPEDIRNIAIFSEHLREKFTTSHLYSPGSGTGCFGLVKGRLTTADGKKRFDKNEIPFAGPPQTGTHTGKNKPEIKPDLKYHRRQLDKEFAELSAAVVTDPLFKILNNYIIALEGTDEGKIKLTNMVRLMYMFATAQSRDSSPYVLAK